jgi:hypothetical protein
LSIQKKLEFLLTRQAFYTTTTLAFVFSVLININHFFSIDVIGFSIPFSQQNETVGNTTTLVTQYFNYYIQNPNEFYSSPAGKYWMLFKFLFRDLGISIALLAINWLILAQMRQSTKRRLKIAGAQKKENPALPITDTATLTVAEGGSAAPVISATAFRSVIAAQKAERKRSIVIVLTGVNYLLGHSMYIPSAVNSFVIQSGEPEWS